MRWPLLGVAAIILAVGTVLTPLRESGWEATAAGTVEPTDQENTPLGAYREEVATRSQLITSVATVLDRGGFANDLIPEIQEGDVAVEVSASPTTSVVSVTATSPSATVAEDVATATMVQGAAFVARLDGPFRLVPLEPTAASQANGWIVENVTRLALGWLTLIIVSLQILRADWPGIRSRVDSTRSARGGIIDDLKKSGDVV